MLVLIIQYYFIATIKSNENDVEEPQISTHNMFQGESQES